MSAPRSRKPRKAGFSRREFLKRAGAGAAVFGSVPMLPGCGSSDPAGRDPGDGGPVFRHGVASGDPLADRVILWTRVTASGSGSIGVRYEIARDPGFGEILGSGQTSAVAARDYTVKVDAAGLEPGTSYYYRFIALGQTSPVGRTRTAPATGVSRLRVGVASCSSYAHGYFNAYQRLAERADLDVVLHLGDYIYEYGDGEYGSARPYEPAGEILTLEDYRTRHAYYKMDPDLQSVHRQHPFIVIWDDHETADNSWRDGANNHTEGLEGVWAQRKAWAIQAYYEWMPIRQTDPLNPERIYRNFQYGDLAEFVMMDTRLIGRDLQASMLNAADVNNPERSLLGPEQRSYVAERLSTSAARWKFLAQQVMFGQLKLLSLPELAQILPLPVLEQLLQSLPLVGTGGLMLNADQWDGYSAERARIFEQIATEGIDNVVVLTGDIHTSWAMDLTPDPANPLAYNGLNGNGSRAVEFVCTSVTSPGLEPLATVQDLIRLLNPHIKYVDLSRKGYLLLDITPEQVTGEFWYVSGIAERGGTESMGIAFKTSDGANRITAAEQTEAPENPPPLAP